MQCFDEKKRNALSNTLKPFFLFLYFKGGNAWAKVKNLGENVWEHEHTQKAFGEVKKVGGQIWENENTQKIVEVGEEIWENKNPRNKNALFYI